MFLFASESRVICVRVSVTMCNPRCQFARLAHMHIVTDISGIQVRFHLLVQVT